MSKRSFSIVLVFALVAGLFSALPAQAQVEPGATGGIVPAEPNIVDAAGDANEHSFATGQAAGLSLNGADILAVWFTDDATNLYTHIQTTNNARLDSLTFITFVGPAAGTDCMQLRMTTEGEGVESFSSLNLSGDCGSGTTAFGPLLEEVGPEDTAILTGTFPLADVEKVATAKLLAEPDALVGHNLREVSARAGIIDDTAVGTDYTIGSGGGSTVEEPPAEEPPGKNDPPGKGKKKGCKKGKGKKKGACPGKKKPKKPKPPVAATCPAYAPGENGKDAPVAVVTDSATEEAPVVVELESEMGGPSLSPAPVDLRSFLFQNVQVDSTAAEAGLYVRFEFPEFRDYDLYLEHADGSTADFSGDAQVAPGELGCGGTSCEAGTNYEQVSGIRTADCAGYTARMAGFFTEGGPVALKVWLGEIKADPTPPGGGESAFDLFYALMGLDDSSDSSQASGTPAAKKGCKKGKGKKKGCKKPPVLSCATYSPGELGADKPLVTVTDAATEAAPVEQKVTLAESVADLDQTGMVSAASADYFNVQVDTTNTEAGLYALLEFPTRRDYDLGLLHADGSYGARSRRWNTISETTDQGPFAISTTGHGGAGTDATELLDGIKTSDCGGWTVEAENWLGEGGEFTIKLWLGEAKVDPQAPGVEPHA